MLNHFESPFPLSKAVQLNKFNCVSCDQLVDSRWVKSEWSLGKRSWPDHRNRSQNKSCCFGGALAIEWEHPLICFFFAYDLDNSLHTNDCMISTYTNSGEPWKKLFTSVLTMPSGRCSALTTCSDLIWEALTWLQTFIAVIGFGLGKHMRIIFTMHHESPTKRVLNFTFWSTENGHIWTEPW